MNSEAVFEQLKKIENQALTGRLAGWLAGWMNGSHENKSCHAAGTTAQKVASWRDILILAGALKQKLEARTRRHEESKSSSKRPCAKARKT